MQRPSRIGAEHKHRVILPRPVLHETDSFVAHAHSRPYGTQANQTNAASVRGGVYVISVAARILEMHPQTLRKYERLGLVTPTRSIGMLRLYSAEDVVRLRLIKYMVENLGMNLAGVEFALLFLNRILGLRERVQALPQAGSINQFIMQELDNMIREMGGFRENSSGSQY